MSSKKPLHRLLELILSRSFKFQPHQTYKTMSEFASITQSVYCPLGREGENSFRERCGWSWKEKNSSLLYLYHEGRYCRREDCVANRFFITPLVEYEQNGDFMELMEDLKDAAIPDTFFRIRLETTEYMVPRDFLLDASGYFQGLLAFPGIESDEGMVDFTDHGYTSSTMQNFIEYAATKEYPVYRGIRSTAGGPFLTTMGSVLDFIEEHCGAYVLGNRLLVSDLMQRSHDAVITIVQEAKQKKTWSISEISSNHRLFTQLLRITEAVFSDTMDNPAKMDPMRKLLCGIIAATIRQRLHTQNPAFLLLLEGLILQNPALARDITIALCLDTESDSV
ncbi:hypothetical protein BJ508DRAFT_323728 [Ascobolus immersus RN42]|uniref:BTB domain-containing protein n=1 Tax=Ascobolus immersus RN42 TaxID=1160509 RepID=A0A3N4IE94_ASCIM|nr:hypothetical protein BJ508DRAFT_323728 [Ascobolus immersus RN42]